MAGSIQAARMMTREAQVREAKKLACLDWGHQ